MKWDMLARETVLFADENKKNKKTWVISKNLIPSFLLLSMAWVTYEQKDVCEVVGEFKSEWICQSKRWAAASAWVQAPHNW